MHNKYEKRMGLVSDNMSEGILNALKTLDGAIDERGSEIRETVQKSFKNLGKVFNEVEKGSEAAFDFAETKGKHLRDAAIKQTSKTIDGVNRQFESKPWLFIGGFTVLGVGIGYLLGRKSS